jgi:rod shape determining protein RodA
MGAQRWIDLGFIRLQPSEMMKFTLVMLLAAYYDWLDPEGLAPALGADPGAADRGADGAGADAAEPWHLADADPCRGTVMFAAGVSLWYFGAVIALGVRHRGGVFTLRGTPWQFLHDYQYKRIDTFLDPDGRPAGRGLQHHSGQDRAGVGRLVGQGLHAGHAVAAELPARKAHRLHLHHAGRGIRLCRGLFAAGALCADHRLLPLVAALQNRDRFSASC